MEDSLDVSLVRVYYVPGTGDAVMNDNKVTVMELVFQWLWELGFENEDFGGIYETFKELRNKI